MSTNSASFLPDRIPLDPNQFTVQWDGLFEMMGFVVVVAFIIERLLSVLFESRLFVKFLKTRSKDQSTYREIIAVGVSILICLFYQIDIMAVLMSHQHVSIVGTLVTAGVIAGGTKAPLKLFRDVLGFKSNAYKEYESSKTDKGKEKDKEKPKPQPESAAK